MCAVPPEPLNGLPPTAPVIVATGVGRTCAAGSALRCHAHRGNVQSGEAPASHDRSHVTSPARPALEPAARVASDDANHVTSSRRGCAGAGPNRSYDGEPLAGKRATQPCAYAASADTSAESGATTSACTHRPSPVAESVAVR